MSYVDVMAEEKLDTNLRVRIDTAKKEALDAAFGGQKISQQDGVIALVDFFLALDDVGRALMLGQIRPGAKDIADLIVRRLHRRGEKLGRDMIRNATGDTGSRETGKRHAQ